MSEPTPGRTDDPVDDRRSDEDRDISDVGLPGPGDDARTDGAAGATGGGTVDVDGAPSAEEEALDEVFPPEPAGG